MSPHSGCVCVVWWCVTCPGCIPASHYWDWLQHLPVTLLLNNWCLTEHGWAPKKTEKLMSTGCWKFYVGKKGKSYLHFQMWVVNFNMLPSSTCFHTHHTSMIRRLHAEVNYPSLLETGSFQQGWNGIHHLLVLMCELVIHSWQRL